MDIEMESSCDNQGNGKINWYVLDKYKEYFKLSQFELQNDPASKMRGMGLVRLIIKLT